MVILLILPLDIRERNDMKTQKEAVYQAVVNVTGFNGEGACQPSREQRATVNMILFEGFRNGEIELDREYDDSELKAYVSGLQSNWLRKDKRLNGGVMYAPKNPGSRVGGGDAQLKALRTLQKMQTDPAKILEIQTFIDKRLAEIKPAATTVSVNVEDLPEELRSKYGVSGS
jgi:hypothetical protein